MNLYSHSLSRIQSTCGIQQLRNERALKRGGLVGGRLVPVPVVNLLQQPHPPPKLLLSPENCYICKTPFSIIHHFYDRLCCKCGDINYAKRSQSADLSGKRAIVTGGRIKIGFEIALKLLRAGAYVIVTTRFSQDALIRYKELPDYPSFATRLHIYQLDMLGPFKQLTEFVAFAKQFPIDILINNAAQTIARPPEFYRLLLQPANVDPSSALIVSQFFPNVVDENGIQVDHRPQNTWTMPLEETPMHELLQVTAINYIVPYFLMKELYPVFTPYAYVINVTAMEGKFNCYKTGYHAHTNAAKAALNMLTRTVGTIWAKQGIFVACVDTGWVTNEYPINDERDLGKHY